MVSRSLAVCGAVGLVLGLAADVPADDGATGSGSARSTTAAAKKTAAKPAAESNGAALTLEKATFGGGCFWCLEAVFEHVKGVKSVVSGYAGGTVPRPYYELVQTGMTGHAEVVQIEYDPTVVTYDQILQIFWSAHDPTTANRQGPDEGTEYRSLILYHNDDQKRAAQKMYQKLTAAHVFPAAIVTQLAPLTRFYPAERYHQNYYRNHKFDPYCEEFIAPKLQGATASKLELMRYKLKAAERDEAAAGRNR
jgi:peptide-methionine (S)-S-oxide reductase